ncbi:uncharacterized protein [Pempheris klunzingeri]|uniref:uncharacterized protein n=1 Tax=Pempheris klunzingeri TaxID=3127111 RepID=UPI00397F0F3F
MTFIRCLEFLLLLLLHQVHGEEAEPMFRAEGNAIEMGYCFGVDYMVVYRSALEGDELLGNSSANYIPFTTPRDLQGRIHIDKKDNLLGLIISHLTHMDSGIYRRECWQNQTLVRQHTVRLSVCNEEVESEEIMVKNGDGGLELLCNSTSIGLEGTSVRWYSETYPTFKLTLILDSSVSLDPLELQGVVGVRDNGALLLLNKSLLKNNQHFYCLVIKGDKCLSFQNMHQPDNIESRDIFASQGDRVVLNCSTDGNNQQWETPLGQINGSSIKNDQMYISSGDKSEDFSLVIAAVSDEHVGDYSCISSSFELQYLLVLCPKKEPQEKVALEGGHIWLDCDDGEHDSQTVQWYRRKPSGEDELILDSYDKTVPIPEDLRGRLTENGSLLGISHLEVKDGGVYWCVVLSPEFLLESDNYEDDYGDEDTEEDESSDDPYWDDTHRCIVKQEILILFKTTRRNLDFEPVTTKTRITNSTAGPPAPSNVTTYAVVAGLVVLLVVGVIVAVIAIKRRANASHKQAASHSGLNTTKDIEMNEDPGCTERLTHNNEYVA